MKASHLILTLSLLTSLEARAQLVTFQLSGTVSSAGVSTFATGRPITFTYTFDLSVAPQNFSASTGVYHGALTSMSINYDNGTYLSSSSTNLMVVVTNHPEQDLLQVFSPLPGNVYPGISTITPSGLSPVNGHTIHFGDNVFFLRDATSASLGSTALLSPVGQNWLNDSNGDGFRLLFSDGATIVQGSITSMSAIPEPSTYALIFGALTLGGAMIRRRQSIRCAQVNAA